MLTLDLSTTCVGWSIWAVDSKQLVSFGTIKPTKKGLSKFSYPSKQLLIMQDIARQIRRLLEGIEGGIKSVQTILIEEVNLHKSRMSGKTLDGAHWILMAEFYAYGIIDRVRYRDSDGPTGWRTRLGLTLTDMDKKANAEHKRINKRKKRGTSDLIIITKKHLAARYVNAVLGTTFDVDKNATDNDVVDALGLALSELLTL